MNIFLHFCVVALLLGLLSNSVLAANPVKPSLMLSKLFNPINAVNFGVEISEYWVSEKLDGVRAYWNGEALFTRTGQRIRAPLWFIESFPTYALDGELWINRGRFDEVSGIARKRDASEEAWKTVNFMVFDLPDSKLMFSQRRLILNQRLAELNIDWLRPVKQTKVNNLPALNELLSEVVAKNGEGLMLHHERSLYSPGRTNKLLKYKVKEDAEAVVVDHLPGQGKYQGKLGALLVRSADGREFKLGSGFSDQERSAPPAIGSQVTYQYSGLTKNGLPRFAVFLRVRDEF